MSFQAFGKYTILNKITSGGMAEIFLASDLSPTQSARFIVIKRALTQYSNNKEFRDMFKNEGKIACNLKHRNIAPIYEFGIENNQFYLAMEYISGRNLREFIKKLRILKKPVNICHTVYIIKEIASGLSYVHNAIEPSTGQPLNLIHRDISPQNIMLSFDGDIRIIDFGISKISDTDLTRVGHLKGKFSYMSPEQARGEVIDKRTDIFCLGIMFWELLSGKRLFSAKNEVDALKKIKSCNVPDIQKINPNIPNELANMVNKCLNKNKSLRYKTATILEKNLSIFLNKNYPEFSQYDFITAIKEAYSKEIIEEREKLKTYSKEFKTYIDKLNDESNFQIQMETNTINQNLDLPTIDAPKEKEANATTLTKEASQILTNYVTHSKAKQDDDTNIISKESKTNILKGKNFDTTKLNENNPNKTQETKKIQTSASHINPNNSKTNLNLEIIKEGKESLSAYSKDSMRTQSKSLESHYYNKQTRVKNQITTQYELEKKVDVIKNVIGFVLILSIGAIVFYGYKNKEKIIHSKKLDKIFKTEDKTTKTLPTIVSNRKKDTTTKRNPTNTSIKKLWIQTQPSGAIVYVNRKSIASTPVLLNIDLNKFNELILYKHGYFPYYLKKEQAYNLSNTLSVALQKNLKKRKIKKSTIIQ